MNTSDKPTATLPAFQVLVIEDNHADAEYLTETLNFDEAGRFEVTWTDHLSTGIRILEGNPIDVVLLDLALPDSFGLDTVVTLHDAVPNVPIVVTTGLQDTALPLQALAAGAQDYIFKADTDSRTLARSVRYAMGRKQLEAAVRHQQQRELMAHKTETVEGLAGGVAHHLNNLLTVIIVSGEFALHQLPESHAAATDLRTLLQSAGRAAKLTRQMVAFSRSAAMAPDLLGLNELVETAVGTFRLRTGTELEVRLSLPSITLEVEGDRDLLLGVIGELLTNAREASAQGGVVDVGVSRLRVASHGTQSQPNVSCALVPGRYAVITIKDDGPGMTPEVEQQAFNPFFTTKTRSGAFGLGLSAAYGIIKQHGGDIELLTSPDAGTSVIVYLPLRERTP